MKLSATILAAGASKRMGDLNKLLLQIDNKPIIYSVCKTALGSKLDQIILVTGYENSKIEKTVPKGIDNIVYNKKWRQGMMSSIYAGLSNLDDDVDGNMIILGDMPLITEHTINLLIDEFKISNGDRIVYPIYEARQANPVIFPKKYFAEILDSEGDKGCKKVLKKHPGDAVGVHINSDEVIVDCDTRDDYLLVEKKLLNNVQT